EIPVKVIRKMWLKPFIQTYWIVYIGYLTIYLNRKNCNVAQNDMISSNCLSMTDLGLIGLDYSITDSIGKTVMSYYADGKNTKKHLPFMLILSEIAMHDFCFIIGHGRAGLVLRCAFYALCDVCHSPACAARYAIITDCAS
ncbi:sugar phosphate antiporter, partial [Vibrio sp. S512-13]